MKKIKISGSYGALIKISLLVLATGMWVAVPYMSGRVAASNSVPVLLRTATLTAPGGAVNPHGDASFEVEASGDRELEVEIEDVNLATGTSVDAVVSGNVVGQIIIGVDRRGKLKLDTEAGQTVPDVQEGTTVQVRNGATVLVAGSFGAPVPIPTPTGSPSASPSPSPTGSPAPSPSPTGTPNANVLSAGLSGPVLNGVVPRGFAEFEVESSHTSLDVKVRQVNLAIGTVLDVVVDNTSVGSITLERRGEGRLRLRSNAGQTVPAITAGSTIAVKNGTIAILSGTFAGIAGPTPSPTPAGSPTPAQGRVFEAHLSGAGVTPPVTTTSRGEMKVSLSVDETQATLFGEFEHLSSSETSAMIQATGGSITTVVHVFDVLGGREGHFARVTIPVTAEQVQQLRAGLWSAVVATVNNPNGEIQGTFREEDRFGDFDGDGSEDLAIFRPSTGVWYSLNNSGVKITSLGAITDIALSGDFDGDGITDSAIFQASAAVPAWQIRRSSDNGLTTVNFGSTQDVPLRGDFDGDGRADIAVYTPSTGIWKVQKSDNTGVSFAAWGNPGDLPMPADMDGDGIDDVSVYRPSTGVWYWIRSSDGGVGIAQWGQAGDVPLRGDFDGDGKADIGVYRPSTGVWYAIRSSDNGVIIAQWGQAGDLPIAGDFDNDGKTDIAVYRPSNGVWYILDSSNGGVQIAQWGQAGDVPVIAQ